MTGYDIAVLVTGDELLSGELQDSNTATIATMLSRYGYRLRCSLAVPDQEKEIMAALDYLSQHARFVIVTGGLGSTRDDLTARAAARVFRQRQVINEEALDMVRSWFTQRNRPMEPSNERQALLPQDAIPIPNRTGTAPGFRLKHGECTLFFLPGVPAEMKVMFEETVLPQLQQDLPGSGATQQRVYKIFGLPEPRINQLIPYADLPEGVAVAFGLDYPLVLLKLRADGEDAGKRLDLAELIIQKIISPHVLACNDESPAANVGKLLCRAGLQLALAESCTGGLLASMLTSAAGASAFFERGGVTYANSAKMGWLGVPQEILEQHGAVSEECARAMATGLKQTSATDVALAITGVAGPDGGSPEKPVGTVYIALAGKEGTHVKRYQFSGSRDQIQKMSAYMALEWIRRYALQQFTGQGTTEE